MKLYKILSEKIHEYPIIKETKKTYEIKNDLKSRYRKNLEEVILSGIFYGSFESFTTNKSKIKNLRKEIINKEIKYQQGILSKCKEKLKHLNNLNNLNENINKEV